MLRRSGEFKLVAMVGTQHIAITVRYEPRVDHGTSLASVAPELRGARLALIDDKLDDPMPSRTWAGPVDARTFERFAKLWGLAGMNESGSGSEPGDDKDKTSYTRTYDGMNWEVGGDSPIISVSVEVGPGPRSGASGDTCGPSPRRSRDRAAGAPRGRARRSVPARH